MTIKKPGPFRIFGAIIILLVIMLIAMNMLLIKSGCLNKQCVLINIFIILLLVWATTFWITVIKHLNKK
ncbi:MAG: hypothetical protein WC569_02775 [Candidatus Omnitrophota bacterium]